MRLRHVVLYQRLHPYNAFDILRERIEGCPVRRLTSPVTPLLSRGPRSRYARVADNEIEAPYGLQFRTGADVGTHEGSSRRMVCQVEPRLARGRSLCRARLTLLSPFNACHDDDGRDWSTGGKRVPHAAARRRLVTTDSGPSWYGHELLCVSDAARIAQRSARTIRRAYLSGRLVAHRDGNGRGVRIHYGDLRAWLLAEPIPRDLSRLPPSSCSKST
jgi:hypothetical protein